MTPDDIRSGAKHNMRLQVSRAIQTGIHTVGGENEGAEAMSCQPPPRHHVTSLICSTCLLRLPNMNLKLVRTLLAEPLDKLLLTELGKLCRNWVLLSDQQETLPDHHAELERRFQAYLDFP